MLRQDASLPLPGGVFEQDGEDSAQPVLRVGGGPGDDPDHPELGGVRFGHPSPVLSALFLHISLRRARVSPRRAFTACVSAVESEGAVGPDTMPHMGGRVRPPF